MKKRPNSTLRRDFVIGFKVNPKERKQIMAASKAAHMNQSEWVMYCVQKELGK